MNVFQLAWRNLWRNGRRTAVTIGAMTFGLWVMILYSGLVNGMLAGMADDILDFEFGDAQIHATGYLDDPSIYTRIEDSDAVIAKLEQAGLMAAPRLLGGGLGASGDASAGVFLRGVDVSRDQRALRLHERVERGEWLDPADPKGVVIGLRLARSLGAKVGSELIVLTQGTDGSMANELYTVRGVLGPVADGTDRAGVFMSDAAYRELMLVPIGAHEIIVRKPKDVPDAQFADELGGLVSHHDVKTWRQLMPTVAQMVDGAKAAIYLVFGLVYIAIGILILNAMLMAVFERIREFGVLKAIGVKPMTVFWMIVVESVMQTVIAIGAGCLLAAPFAWWLATSGLNVGSLAGTSMMGLSMPPVWKGLYTPETVSGPIVVLCVIVGFAIVYPAIKAARIEPLDAMRYR